MKLVAITVVASLLSLSFNFALAYSINSTQELTTQSPIDQNIATKAISDSIREVVDNVLKSFVSGQSLNITNIPKIPQTSNSGETFKNISDISSSGVASSIVDFIKLSINLLFTTTSVVTEILKALLNSLNSHGG